MGQALGLLTMGAQLGLEAILIKPKRGFGGFTAAVTLRETHTDELEVTEHPVEQGASIADHAFKKPAVVVIECAWSDTPQNVGIVNGLIGAVTGTLGGIGAILSGASPQGMKAIYGKLLDLQNRRETFAVFTGKRQYPNMLLKAMVVHTDKESENILALTATLHEVIIVKTTTTATPTDAPPAEMFFPESTSGLLDKGIKSLTDGLPSLNVGAAAQSLVSSAAGNIGSMATSALSSVTGGLSGALGGLGGGLGGITGGITGAVQQAAGSLTAAVDGLPGLFK